MTDAPMPEVEKMQKEIQFWADKSTDIIFEYTKLRASHKELLDAVNGVLADIRKRVEMKGTETAYLDFDGELIFPWGCGVNVRLSNALDNAEKVGCDAT